MHSTFIQGSCTEARFGASRQGQQLRVLDIFYFAQAHSPTARRTLNAVWEVYGRVHTATVVLHEAWHERAQGEKEGRALILIRLSLAIVN